MTIPVYYRNENVATPTRIGDIEVTDIGQILETINSYGCYDPEREELKVVGHFVTTEDGHMFFEIVGVPV